MTITTMEQLQLQITEETGYDSYDIASAFNQLSLETFTDLKESELFAFLRSVLSKERMVLFEEMLDLLQTLPYSQSYYRRSYRAPGCVMMYGTRIAKIILHLKNQPEYDFYEVFAHNGKTDYENGSWQFVTNEHKPIVSAELFTYELAVKLNAKEARLEAIIREILWKNGAHPLYNKELIRGIIMSQNEEMHQLLANVLLAAKNQEGVRQVITESIDEGSLKSQLAFMKVILEHDLLRFSSVARAIDVWFGLGYDVSESRQLQYVLQTGYAALQDDALIETLLSSSSNLDIFIALWCIGSRDINDVLERADYLLSREDYVQQTLLYTLRNMEINGRVSHLVYPYMLKTTNLVTFLYGFKLVATYLPYGSRYSDKDERQTVQEFFDEHPWLAEHAAQWLEKVEQFIGEFRGDTYTVDRTPFTFLHATFSKLELFKLQLLLAIYLEDDSYIAALAANVSKMSVDCREYFYFFAPACMGNYDLLLPAIKDRSSGVRFDAIKQLKHIQFPLEKMKQHIPSLLSLKAGDMRIAVIELLKGQPIDQIEAMAEELLQSKKENVRLGILELLVECKGQLTKSDWASYLPEPTAKELKYLRQFEETRENFLAEPMEPIHYIIEPETDMYYTFKDFIYHDFELLEEKLQPLRALIEKHAEVEYERENYYGENISTLIGNYLQADASKAKMPGSIDELPLAEVWVDWLLKSDVTVDDVCCYLYAKAVGVNKYWFRRGLTDEAEAFFDDYVPVERQQVIFNLFGDALYEQQLSTIMHYVLADGDAPLQTMLRGQLEEVAFDYGLFCSNMLCEFASNGYDADLGEKYKGQPYTAIDIEFFSAALSAMGTYVRSPQQIIQYFYTVAQFFERVEEQFEYISLAGVVSGFSAGILTEKHVRRILCMKKFHYVLEQRQGDIQLIGQYARGQDMLSIIDELKEFVIEEELCRGDLETETTEMVRHIRSVSGIDYFVRLLQVLDGEKLSRQWMYGVQTRKDSLSNLLGKVVLNRQETNEECFAKLDAAGFTDARLIEAMLYNSALIPLISEYIGWDGLEEVAWYFIAHTSESTSDFETAKIMEYSAIPVADFQRGAFDRTWFVNARANLTQQQFNQVYDAAKYASSGSNHRRAQLYARATLGELDGVQLKEEIAAKRNKDKLRAYSLMPANMGEAKERYLFFRQFLKESRQFGAQRRASEAESVEMAIFNLAQQVASGNTTQFMWQMEQERYKELEAFFTPLDIDGVQLCLVQEGQKVELEIMKQGKAIKSVPKKLAKHPEVLAVQSAKKELTDQYRRMKQQLEESMCEEVLFDAAIIYGLLENRLLAGLLSNLIWQQGDRFFAISDKQFITSKYTVTLVAGDIQIAHPAHFFEAGNWREWQHFVFEQGYKQPFKQVFREFYLPTKGEREQLSTNRFEGYQIQPTKAVALLKSRGWKTGYYEPLRKISYRYNVIAYADFVYDAYTPADVEMPTLEDIYFAWRLTSKKARLDEVAPVYFSEVMRDLDLVVSVAHAGDVDPEASHSTVEMRAVIAEEMIQLFQLSNVQVKAPHIIIKGSMGDYTIHLGSGNVHQLGGAMIPVIAIPSQQRGRVFLPFVDEDPKTAEISAKLLLFADDEKINDPNIRASIRQ
ncbi:DUF5724 domain-containing protein [Solibacillus silvestris]|uniref:DUF4132 domain-containing protein n=1 Tax=Solibacillus silvestris TaxID=76853 RepID=UPI003F8188B3